MPRRLALWVLAFSFLGFLTPAADAWYPRAAQVEELTATWCANCPNMYQGIEVNKAFYDPNEFTAIRYYADTGGLFSAASTARLNYYANTSRFPEAIFDGTMRVSGGDPDFADGLYYRALIQTELCKPSYFKITVNSFDNTAPSGSIDLDIEVMETLPSIANLNLRMILTEKDVVWVAETMQDVTRAQVGSDIAITVQNEGQIQHVNQTFAIDPSWVGAKLNVVAFIQDDTDRSVMASASTRPNVDYNFRYYALGDRMVVGPITSHHHYQPFRVINTGQFTDLFYLQVVTSGPQGWFGVLCDESTCYGPYVDIVLEPGQYQDFYLDMQAATSGYGNVTINIWEDMRTEHVAKIKYAYITDDVDFLLVDDDGARTYESYYKSALDHYGYKYGVWDHDAFGTPPADIMAGFDAVVWTHGRVCPSLDAADRAALATYLDDGGKLFISGENLSWELDNQDFGRDWFRTYLHASYFANNTNDYTLDGVEGDPISDGLAVTIQGAGGANNQTSPDDIRALDASATVCWTYAANKNAGVRIDTGVYRAVYFAFGFEAITDASIRQGLMNRVIGWLLHGGSDVAGDDPVIRPALTLSPNPVLTSASVHFALPAAESVVLRLFSPDGRLLRTLAEGRMDPGRHSVTWDRTGASGEPLPAGVYYCRLDGEQTRLSTKVIVVR